MDSFELNKIAGALLGTLLFVMGLGMLGDVIFSPHKPVVAGYDLPAAEDAPKAGAAQAAAAPAVPLPQLLAKADAKKGEAQAKACAACHSFDKGGANKIGPALYGIVDRAKAAAPGFGYSAASKEAAAKGGKWDFASLDAFINNPKGYLPGTSMGYAGLKDAEKRADLLAYLRTLSDNPAPLPQ